MTIKMARLEAWCCHNCLWAGKEPYWEKTVDWVPAPFGTGNVPMETQEPFCPVCHSADIEET